LETLTGNLRQQVEQERISEQRDLPTLQVLDPAITPERRSSPNRVSMLLLGLFIGFLLSIIYVFIRNYQEQVRSHPAEHMKYLAFITTLRNRKTKIGSVSS
jgi:tyrosine-protein kinase Etk/Wzc